MKMIEEREEFSVDFCLQLMNIYLILLGRSFVQESFFLTNFENNRTIQSPLHKNLTR